jgi:hypothetical protein
MKCIVCGSPLESLLDLGKQPFANSHVSPSDGNKPEVHELILSLCGNEPCSHVQLSTITSPSDHFSHYLWTTSSSRGASEWSFNLSKKILSYFSDRECNSLRVAEIASNDGTFLVPFLDNGCQTIGIDPAKNLAAIARTKGIHTISAFFDNKSASKATEHLGGPPDVLIARNVIAHTPYPVQMLQDCANTVDVKGLCFVEFHDLDSIVKGLQYDSIYHEHYSYFSMKSITYLAQSVGLRLIDYFDSPLSGGATVCVFSKGQHPVFRSLPRHKQIGLSRQSFETFASRSLAHSLDFADQLRKLPRPVVGLGSSARSNTLLNTSGINAEDLDAIADSNPLKQGLLAPGSQIPIVSPEEISTIMPRSIILLAWNFTDEIMSTFAFGDRLTHVLVPLPSEIRLYSSCN